MTRIYHWYDYITFNIYFLGLSTLAQTLSPLVYPLLVQQFVGEQAKGSFFGSLRLWSLMVALLAQSFWGILSDRTTLRWGRRRPYIFGGTLVNLLFIGAIGLSAGMSGSTGYIFLFIVALLLQISSNAAQAAQQALIPDLVPEEKRGRFSAFKALFEVPLPLILVSFTIGRVIGSGNMVGGILIAVVVLVISMILAMFVREQPLAQTPPPLRGAWQPFVRLVLMTALFTVVILGLGEATKFFGTLLVGINDVITLMVLFGIVGVLAMMIAVGLGVYASVRISLGDAAKSNPSFTWWVVNRLAFLVGTVNISTFVVFFLQGRLGLVREKAAGPAANLLLVVGILILISALASGWLSDRIGQKRTVAMAGIIAAIGVAIAIAVPDMTAINIGGAFLGLGTGMFYTANWALGTKLVPQAEAGRYLGISNLAGAGAGAVGAYIGGPLADIFTVRFPEIPGIGYVLLFAIYGVLILSSVVALARVNE
ncbi:MAG: MFS transporter [Chloroflexi bacterium]|nr:MFS transporter [Chloroflexota bacterium]